MTSQQRPLNVPRQDQYRILRDADLRDHLAQSPAVVNLLGGSPADWSISEVGDGNLNLVFIVKGSTGGIAVKQALPYVRLVGESWPLPLSRSHYEYRALVHQARLAPGLVPAVLHHNEALALIAMELLEPHIIIARDLFPESVIHASSKISRPSWRGRCSSPPTWRSRRRKRRKASPYSLAITRYARSPRI